MIKLSEILHTIKDESKQGLTPVDNWNLLHATFLEDMQFKTDGQYHYSLQKPSIKVAHKKGSGFVVEDKSHKKSYIFKDFNEVTEFFSKYQQKWENAPYQESEDQEQTDHIEKSEPEEKPNTTASTPDYKAGVKKWDRM